MSASDPFCLGVPGRPLDPVAVRYSHDKLLDVLNTRVLVVDDDPDIQASIATILGDQGFHVDSAFNGVEGLDRLQAGSYDLVLTAIVMAELDGLQLLRLIQECCPSTPVVAMASRNTPDKMIRSIRERGVFFFSKPFSSSALVEMVGRALESPTERGEIEILSARPGSIALRLRCKLDVADRLLQVLRHLPFSLPAKEQDEIATAFRELVISAIEHGGRSDAQRKVDVACIRLSRAVLYYIRDSGDGFTFESLPDAAVSGTHVKDRRDVSKHFQSGTRPGVFATVLARRIADELVHNEKGNEVLLVKYLPALPQPQAIQGRSLES